MVSRRSIMKQIRENVLIESMYTFSEPRKNHQRVKLWLCSNKEETAENIRKYVQENGLQGITVETAGGVFTGWGRSGSSVVIRFDNKVYN